MINGIIAGIMIVFYSPLLYDTRINASRGYPLAESFPNDRVSKRPSTIVSMIRTSNAAPSYCK